MDAKEKSEARAWKYKDISEPNMQAIPDDAFEFALIRAEEKKQKEERSAPTVEELNNIHEQAYQEGLKAGEDAGYQAGLDKGVEAGQKQGYQEGLKEGIAAGQQQIDAALAEISALMDAFSHPFNEIELLIQAKCLELTLALSKAVINHELSVQPELLVKCIEEAIHSLPISEQKLLIEVPTSLAKIINQQNLITEPHQLIENDALGSMQCKVSQGYSTVDFDLNQKIAHIFKNVAKEHENLMAQVRQGQNAQSVIPEDEPAPSMDSESGKDDE